MYFAYGIGPVLCLSLMQRSGGERTAVYCRFVLSMHSKAQGIKFIIPTKCTFLVTYEF